MERFPKVMVRRGLEALGVPNRAAELVGRGRFRDEKALAAWWVRHRTAVSNRWLGERLVIVIVDENLPPRWRDCPEADSHEVFHWREIGEAGDGDELILDEALRRGALILTQDLDFTRLLALRGSRLPSVIQLRVSCPLPGEVGAEVLQLLASHADPLAKGCLISLNAAEHRVRLLPLRRAGGE